MTRAARKWFTFHRGPVTLMHLSRGGWYLHLWRFSAMTYHGDNNSYVVKLEWRS